MVSRNTLPDPAVKWTHGSLNRIIGCFRGWKGLLHFLRHHVLCFLPSGSPHADAMQGNAKLSFPTEVASITYYHSEPVRNSVFWGGSFFFLIYRVFFLKNRTYHRLVTIVPAYRITCGCHEAVSVGELSYRWGTCLQKKQKVACCWTMELVEDQAKSCKCLSQGLQDVTAPHTSTAT